MRIALIVDTDKRLIHCLQDALETRKLGSIAIGLAQFLRRGGNFEFCCLVDDRDGRGWNTQTVTIQFAGHVGDYQFQSLGRARRSGDDA